MKTLVYYVKEECPRHKNISCPVFSIYIFIIYINVCTYVYHEDACTWLHMCTFIFFLLFGINHECVIMFITILRINKVYLLY